MENNLKNNIYIYMYVCIYIYIYIYMYVCVCLYVYICWERIKAKGEEGGSLKWLGSIIDSMDMNLSKLPQIAKYTGSLACCIPWVTKTQT